MSPRPPAVEEEGAAAGRSPRRLRGFVLGSVLLAILAWLALSLPSSWLERIHARGFYPWLASWWIPLTSAAAVPLGMVAGAGLAVVATVAVVTLLWRARASGVGPGRQLGRLCAVAIGVAAIHYAVFVLVWGAAYARAPLGERLGLTEEAALREPEVRDILESLIGVIERDAGASRDPERAVAAIAESLARRLVHWGGTSPTLPRNAKQVPAGWLLAFGTSGMVFPFTLEAYVDGGLPEAARVAVAGHELAHLVGLADEGDADFAAALAGLESDDAYARYATALRLLGRFLVEVPGALRAELLARLPEVARRDRERLAEAYRRYHVGFLADLQRRVFDLYLRSQGVDDGVRSYSRGLRLLVAARRAGLLQTAPSPAAKKTSERP